MTENKERTSSVYVTTNNNDLLDDNFEMIIKKSRVNSNKSKGTRHGTVTND